MLVALCATYAIACVITRPPGPLTSPDSEVYRSFSPIVPAGYPAFLRLVGDRRASVVQPVVYATALAFLGVETLALSSSLTFSGAVIAASIAVPGLTTYHASILTESLFMSGLVGFLAAVIRFTRAPSPGSAATAAALAGLATTLRSTGYAFLPVLVVMVLLYRHRLGGRVASVMLAATLPMLAIAGGERLVARVMQGDRLVSLMGRHLFAKAALIDAPLPLTRWDDRLHEGLQQELDMSFAPIRALIAGAPRDVRAVMTLYYETCLQGPCVSELGESRPGSENPKLADALAQVSRRRIARAPIAFVGLTATEYAALWTPYKQHHPDVAPSLNALITAGRPLPFEWQAFRLRAADAPAFVPYPAVRWLQPIVGTLGWLTGGLAVLGLTAAMRGRQRSPPLAVACLAALAAHAGLLLSAVFAAGIARFVVALWPAITTATLFAGWSAYTSASARP
jgi:hypothetical protein